MIDFDIRQVGSYKRLTMQFPCCDISVRLLSNDEANDLAIELVKCAKQLSKDNDILIKELQ